MVLGKIMKLRKMFLMLAARQSGCFSRCRPGRS